VDVVRGQHANAAVVVLAVVPMEEGAAVPLKDCVGATDTANHEAAIKSVEMQGRVRLGVGRRASPRLARGSRACRLSLAGERAASACTPLLGQGLDEHPPSVRFARRSHTRAACHAVS
jgi:hypothetical protein